jgi:hypothetical protein
MSLTDTAIRSAKSREKPYKLSDEKGLYVQVNPNGSKLWHLKYRFADKDKEASFRRVPRSDACNGREISSKPDVCSRVGSIPASTKSKPSGRGGLLREEL